MHSFPKTGAENCFKKNLEHGNILYNSTGWLTGHPENSTELLVDWASREFQNQTLLFSEKIKSLI